MKQIIFVMTVLVAGPLWAADDCIIDPELMNKGVWAEPVFRAPGEPARDVAVEGGGAAVEEKNPNQYLDVLAQIPFSEPTVNKTWIDHRILNTDSAE